MSLNIIDTGLSEVVLFNCLPLNVITMVMESRK